MSNTLQGPEIDPRLLRRAGGPYGPVQADVMPATGEVDRMARGFVSNLLANIGLALEEGLTISPSTIGMDFGIPEKMWDPRLLGLLAGTIAVIEPGPGGEAKTARNTFLDMGPLEKVVEAAKGFIRKGKESVEDLVSKFNKAAEEAGAGLALVKPTEGASGLYILKDLDTNTYLSALDHPGNLVEDMGSAIYGKAIGDKIVGEAVKLPEGRIVSGSHRTVGEMASEAAERGVIPREQLVGGKAISAGNEYGFLTNRGVFVTPEEALPIARKSGMVGEYSERLLKEEGRTALHPFDLPSDYPLAWGEWNQGRSLREMLSTLDYGDDLYFSAVPGKELLDALGRASSDEVNNYLNQLYDILMAGQHPAIHEATRANMDRAFSELARRALIEGDYPAMQLLGGAGMSMEELARDLPLSLSDASFSSALAEILMKRR